jgi:type I restriction enzyme S subunit
MLSLLDKKIALNAKINAKLEKMSKIIYDQWFVQFDFPDENNRPYKTNGGLMIYNEILKREIPAEWQVKKLSEACLRTQSGGTPSTKNESFYSGKIKWFSTKELGDTFLLDSDKHISQGALDGSSARLFPANSVLIAIYASPTAGRLGILSSEGAINQAITGIEPKGEFSSEYIFMTLLSTRQQLLALASGTSQQNLSNQIIRDYQVLIPPDTSLQGFNAAIKPVFVQIRANRQESERLAHLRDWLLPILMNGQIFITG